MDKKGTEKYLDYSKIILKNGADYGYEDYIKYLIIEFLEKKRTSLRYDWDQFTEKEKLRNNLEQYGSWGEKKIIKRRK